MASTRNKNTKEDYALERWSSDKINQEAMYLHGTQGQAFQTNLAGNGLLPAKYASRDLAKNHCDIESYLFGIGSTNLVNPLPPLKPEIKTLQSLNIIDKLPLIRPTEDHFLKNQRPLYLN